MVVLHCGSKYGIVFAWAKTWHGFCMCQGIDGIMSKLTLWASGTIRAKRVTGSVMFGRA